MRIKQSIHSFLLKHPLIKKSSKRIYQRANVLIKKPKKYEGLIECVSPEDDNDYFFGYYDKSPWDITNRYMLCMKAKDTSKSVTPKEELEILLIDTIDKKTEAIGKSRSWNVQQGCMAQWLGPKYDTYIIYNDFRDGKYCSVILDVFSKKERIIDMPIYSVSNDGKFALSLDFSRLHRLRPGYGYSNIEDSTSKDKVPNSPCIWIIDLEKNITKPFLMYEDFYNFNHRKDMENAEHKINHIMISPDNDKFMVIHRWLKGNKKYSRLITCDIKSKKMYNLSDDNMVSHCYWKNNNEIIGFLNKKDLGNGYYIMEDKTQKYHKLWDHITSDGHPSFSPDGTLVVTDTYPDKKRMCSLKIMNKDEIIEVAKVFSPFKYDNDTRCDLHPRWSRDSNSICIDSCHEGKRRLYVISKIYINLPHKVLNKNINSKKEETGLVSCVIPTFKRCDTIQRAIDSVLSQTYKNIEILVVNDNTPNDKYSKQLKNVMKKYSNNPRVRLILQPEHINGAVARNYGIKESNGEFVAFLDDDDEWLPTKIEKQIKYFDDSNIDIVSCFWTSYKNGKIIRKCYPYNSKNINFKILSREISIFTSTIIMRKNIIKEFGGFNETLTRHQDLQFLIDACEFGNFNVDNEYLVNLYADSDINRPNTNKLINAKKKFLKLEKNKIDKFNIINRLRIYGAHNYEVLFSAIKEKKIFIIMLYFLKVFLNIFAFIDVIKRYSKRNNK